MTSMPLPSHISEVLDRFGIRPETKAMLTDLYLSLGSEVFEVLADIASNLAVVSTLTPEDLQSIPSTVVERFLRKNHPLWSAGQPTESLWHPREVEGRASGLTAPLGDVSEESSPETLGGRLSSKLREIIGDDQPRPEGMLIFGRNAHFGGRSDSVSFDIVPFDLDEALAVGAAEGRQHTTPGSVGETSGSWNGMGVGLIWEVQPNVLKPADERNRAITKIYRKHRNWHIATLTAALLWYRERTENLFVLRGAGLAVAHQVNDAKPVGVEVADHHDRTVARVVSALGGALSDATPSDAQLLLDAEIMNTSLTAFVDRYGPGDVIARVTLPSTGSATIIN
jgi:hypothetical protein